MAHARNCFDGPVPLNSFHQTNVKYWRRSTCIDRSRAIKDTVDVKDRRAAWKTPIKQHHYNHCFFFVIPEFPNLRSVKDLTEILGAFKYSIKKRCATTVFQNKCSLRKPKRIYNILRCCGQQKDRQILSLCSVYR